MTKSREQITAVILAGGKGSRLAHADKGLVTLDNIPLVQHLINRIKPQVNEIIISANRNIETYSSLGLTVFKDDMDGFAGPLAGILKALQQSKTDWLLVTPADSPFIPTDLALRLMQNSGENKVVIPHDGKYLHPTSALIHKSLIASLEAFLQQGERKARVWMQQQTHAVVDFSDQPDAFMNINTQEDLENAEKHFKEIMR